MPPNDPNAYGPNGIVWGSDPYRPENTPLQRIISAGVATSAAAGFFALSRTDIPGVGRSIDAIQRGVRYGANSLLPFGVLNTFQAAEHLSPFVTPYAYANKSTEYLKIKGDRFTYTIGSEFLGTSETADYLRAVLGVDALPSGTVPEGSKIQFRGSTAGGPGELYLMPEKGPEKLLSKAVRLVEARSLEPELASPFRRANTYFESIVNALVTNTGETLGERFEDSGKSVNRIFAEVETAAKGAGKVVGAPMLAVVPDLLKPDNIDFGSFTDFYKSVLKGTTLPRAFLAFGMERLNRLGQQFLEQVPMGNEINDFARRNFNASLGVKSGSASKMFARFGIKASVGLVGIPLLIQQTDWLRRQGDLPGQVMASGMVSIASTALLGKVGFRKGAMAAGIASFFGQMMLPDYDKGLWQGMVSTAAGLDVAKTAVGELLLFNSYNRVVEGFLPGVSGIEMGVLAGLTTLGASYASPVPKWLLKNYGKSLIGEDIDISKLPKSFSELYYQNVLGERAADMGFFEVRKEYFDLHTKMASSSAEEYAKFHDKLHRAYDSAIQQQADQLKKNPLDEILHRRLKKINKETGSGFLSRAMGFLRRGKETALFSFLGAEQGDAINYSALGLKKRAGRLGIVFGAGFVAQQLLTGGLLGSLSSPLEKYQQYFEGSAVPVRRARFWESGGSPFAGEDIMYYRPSYLQLLRSRARERSIWGEDEDRISPIGKFLRKNFTYELEKRQYYDRPYPITGGFLEDLPIIGRIIAGTFGQIIKPQRLMHVPEWARLDKSGGVEFAYAPEYGGPAYNLGGLTPGVPISSSAPSRILGNISYQFREMEGLTGFVKNLVQKSVTGSDLVFSGRPELASASLMGSLRESFWELNLGGGAFTTEMIRRFLPNDPSEKQEYNPILNSMPSWMPSRFHYGDPYRKVEMGYARMPGSGYEALHPELAGLTPENYPLIYRYEILGDVAPTSREFKRVRQQLYTARAEGQTSPEIDAYMDRIDAQINQKRIEDFSPVRPGAIELPGSGLTQRAFAGAQTIVRKVAAPAEYLVPGGFRPFQKFLSDRDAIEQYEHERLYGSKVAFWDEPVRDWIRPSFHSAMNLLGWRGKPGWRKDADAINEYFDKVEFAKHMALAEQASFAGDNRAASRYRYEASKTRYGVNPMGDPMGIYMSLPDSEKKFFDAFSFAQGGDRSRILEMVPEDQAHLYQAIWSRLDEGEQIYPGSSTAIGDAYLNQRMHDLQDYFYDKPMPGTDWVGWHEDAELDDIKLRYIDSLGKDIHEYDMWHKQKRMLMRKPYLEGSENFLLNQPIPGRGGIYNVANQISRGPNTRYPMEMSVFRNGTGFRSSGSFYYNDGREAEIRRGLMGAME